jgi:hypothetical protein
VIIYINGIEADITLDTEKTLGDVLASLDREFDAHDAAIIGVELEGSQIPEADIDNALGRDIAGIQTLSLAVMTAPEVLEAMKGLCADFEALAARLEDVPVQLQSGKQGDAATAIRDAADTINTFCFYGRALNLFGGAEAGQGKFDSLLVEGKPLADFFADFTPILQDFCGALENSDIVMIGDLAEYEIKPRVSALANALESW